MSTCRRCGLIRRPMHLYAGFCAACVTRDLCPTCNEQRDEQGRLPIGFCGDGCLMRQLRGTA